MGWTSLNALTDMAIDYMLNGKLYLALKNLEQMKDILNELDSMENSTYLRTCEHHHKSASTD